MIVGRAVVTLVMAALSPSVRRSLSEFDRAMSSLEPLKWPIDSSSTIISCKMCKVEGEPKVEFEPLVLAAPFLSLLVRDAVWFALPSGSLFVTP